MLSRLDDLREPGTGDVVALPLACLREGVLDLPRGCVTGSALLGPAGASVHSASRGGAGNMNKPEGVVAAVATAVLLTSVSMSSSSS